MVTYVVRKRPSAIGETSLWLLLGCCGVVIVILVYLAVVRTAPLQLSFSRERWHGAPVASREGMAADYLRNHYKEGISLSAVLSDLGQPQDTHDWWAYCAGPNGLGLRGERSDPDYRSEPILYVWFAADAVVIRCTGVKLGEPETAEHFESGAWTGRVRRDRIAMARTILDQELLSGKDKQSVRSLLGEPDAVDRNRWVRYQVGYAGSDEVSLRFFVDSNDRISAARIER